MRTWSLPAALIALSLLVLRCATALPQDAMVRRAIDGDTVELMDGRLVRYIGIDTPELRRRVRGRWVVDPEPFAREALEANQRLVEGKRVRLEYDVRTRDRYGRLLAYVYVDGQMVNAQLLAEGRGRVTDFHGHPACLEEGQVVASNGSIHRAMLRILAP